MGWISWVGGGIAVILFALMIFLAFLAAWGTMRALIARHTSHVYPPPPAPLRRRAF
jgi:hypothetical protein